MQTVIALIVLALAGCSLTPEQAAAFRQLGSDLERTGDIMRPTDMDCRQTGPGRMSCSR